MMSGKPGAAILPDWPAPARVRAASTIRTGGSSKGPYASLNLGMGVGDDSRLVTRNRGAMAELLGLPSEPLWLRQVHGTRVLDLDVGSMARTGSNDQPPEADGAVTATAGRPCVVLTADCLPVLFCDTGGTRVGVAHAGWRGLLGGVLETAVERMAVEPDRLLAWIGPCIGQQAYEVGAEVLERFAAREPKASRFFTANANGRWQADLCGVARQRLRAAGVNAIYGGTWCTHTESDLFFSHRREAPCGRMATVIWLALI